MLAVVPSEAAEASMRATLTLIDLAGSIALLLWGLHMVQSGIERGCGPNLRRLLGRALGSRPRAFLAGLGTTALLQSSTATALMATGFAASGLVGLVPGLAAMLGANVGTTLIVQLLSFDIARIAPLFVLVGLLMFRRGGMTRTHDFGRVAIGLGLVLIALAQLEAAIAPYEHAPGLRPLMAAIASEPVIGLVLAAALTWAAHSSVAVVLVVMSLAAKGILVPQTAFALVLGANLGTALVPLAEGGAGGDPAARRLAVGNLANRVVGCAVALAVLAPATRHLTAFEPTPDRAVADFHTLFNLATAALFYPVLGPLARLLSRLLPARGAPADPSRPQYLDRTALETPAIALAGAAREALRMVDVLEAMLQGAEDALDPGDRKRVAATKRLDDVLDRLNGAIKGYLTALDPELLNAGDERRLAQVLSFITNLEHAGDVVEKGLMPNAAKRIKLNLAFSPEGLGEMRDMLHRLTDNLRTSAAVFMTEDLRAARRLIGEEEVFRDLEARASEAHFRRIRAGRVESVETSALHLDILRDLKRINAHLAAAAYPVLERHGELLPSRLKQEE